MKKIIVVLLFILPLISKSQNLPYSPNIPVDTNFNKVDFTEVIELPGVSKEKIFDRAKDWFTRYYSVAQARVTMSDRKGGQIVATATIFRKSLRGLLNLPYSISLSIFITVKDGKYKYSITNFTEGGSLDDEQLPVLKQVDDYVNDTKHKPGKDDFSGNVKRRLQMVEEYSTYVSLSLKDAILSTRLDYKNLNEEDF